MSTPPNRMLQLAGELTVFTAAAIREQLRGALAAAPGELEVDLSGITDCDTAGVQLLIASKRQAARSGKGLTFSGHSVAVIDSLDAFDLVAHLGDPVLIRSRT